MCLTDIFVSDTIPNKLKHVSIIVLIFVPQYINVYFALPILHGNTGNNR